MNTKLIKSELLTVALSGIDTYLNSTRGCNLIGTRCR